MPKQLQLTLLSTTPLGDTPSPTSASPTTLHSLPSGSATPHSGYRRPGNARRQSSISYITTPTSSPKTPGCHSATRSMSYNGPGSPRPFVVASTPVESNGRTRSPPLTSKAPLTLAEEHSDLLSEMATKESLCLELKSQLATHEAELQILKEKWHKIINGGTTVDEKDAPAPETIMNGLKDGMNNMGKFIAAGISEVVAPVPPPPRYQATPMVRRTHSSKASTASSSTSSNSSIITRLSESSVSSVEETAPNAEETAQGGDAVFDAKKDHGMPKTTSRLSSPPSSPLNPTTTRQLKRQSLTADFPVPGIGIASLMSTPAVSGWLSNIGSRWEDLQKSQTYTKGHERAASFMSDITQTFTQAFPPQPSLSLSSSSSSGSLADSSAIGPGGTLTPIPESHTLSDDAGSDSPLMTAEPDAVMDEWNW